MYNTHIYNTDILYKIWYHIYLSIYKRLDKNSEQELQDFMSDLNKKHPSIKFEFKYSPTKIEFLDALVCKDQNNMLQKTIYRKQTDR